jgi:hypothetical protein
MAAAAPVGMTCMMLFVKGGLTLLKKQHMEACILMVRVFTLWNTVGLYNTMLLHHAAPWCSGCINTLGCTPHTV